MKLSSTLPRQERHAIHYKQTQKKTRITLLMFWRKKTFMSTSVVLGAFSCIVRNRFVSVGSKYEVTACMISKCGIKGAVWHTFSNVIHL